MFYDLDHELFSFPSLYFSVILEQICLVKIFPVRLCFIFTKLRAKKFSQFIYVCSACCEIRAAICLVCISRSVVEKLQKNMMGSTD